MKGGEVAPYNHILSLQYRLSLCGSVATVPSEVQVSCQRERTSRSHGCFCEPAASLITGGRRVRNVTGIPSCCINQQLFEWLHTSASFSHRWAVHALSYTTGGNDARLWNKYSFRLFMKVFRRCVVGSLCAAAGGFPELEQKHTCVT